MSVGVNKKAEQLGTKLSEFRQILQSLKGIVKKQAMRALRLQTVFKFNKSQQQLFDAVFGDINLQVYQQYSHLLSKQISNKLTQLSKIIDELRTSLSKIQTKIKNNKQAVPKLQQQLKQIQKSFGELLNKTYLMANYRLDIVAKQLQKWTNGFNYLIDQGQIAKDIDKLF